MRRAFRSPASNRFDTVSKGQVLPRTLSAFVVVAAMQLAMVATDAKAVPSLADGDPSETGRRPAVARANVRVLAGYDYSHVDRTRASFFDPNTSTTSILQFDEVDRQRTRAELVGTLGLAHSLGLRGRLRGGYGNARRRLDGLDPGNDDFDTASYGVVTELFARDPELGALTVGGSYDRLDGDGGFEADEFGGSAAVAIFFPDMGSGPVDWTLRFDYLRRQISGAGSSFDVDSFGIRGGAGWYLTKDFQLEIGGRWSRSDAEVFIVEDREGFMNLRWFLPMPVSVELSVGGSAGVSEYKESPFSSDDRLNYGANMGLTFRFRSAANLIDAIRAYD